MYSQTNDGYHLEMGMELGFVEDSPVRPIPRRREDVPQTTGYIPFTMWNNYRTGFARKGQSLDSAVLSGKMNCFSFVQAYDELKTKYYEVEETLRYL